MNSFYYCLLLWVFSSNLVAFSGKSPGIHWAFFGYSLTVRRLLFGCSLDILRVFSDHSLGIIWAISGKTLEILLPFSSHSPAILQRFSTLSPVKSSYSSHSQPSLWHFSRHCPIVHYLLCWESSRFSLSFLRKRRVKKWGPDLQNDGMNPLTTSLGLLSHQTPSPLGSSDPSDNKV